MIQPCLITFLFKENDTLLLFFKETIGRMKLFFRYTVKED